MQQVEQGTGEDHYAHVPEKFRKDTINGLVCGPSVWFLLQGERGKTVAEVKRAVGSTLGWGKEPESWRFRLAESDPKAEMHKTFNGYHCSDSAGNVRKEMERFGATRVVN